MLNFTITTNLPPIFKFSLCSKTKQNYFSTIFMQTKLLNYKSKLYVIKSEHNTSLLYIICELKDGALDV